MRFSLFLILSLLVVACDAGTDPGPCTSGCGNLIVATVVLRGITLTATDTTVEEVAFVRQQYAAYLGYPPPLLPPAQATINGMAFSAELYGRDGLYLQRSTESSGPFLAPVGAMNYLAVDPGSITHGLYDSIATPRLAVQIRGIAPGDTLHLGSSIVIDLAEPLVPYGENGVSIQLIAPPDSGQSQGEILTFPYELEEWNGLAAEVPVSAFAMALNNPVLGEVHLRMTRTTRHNRTGSSGRPYTVQTIAYEEFPVVVVL